MESLSTERKNKLNDLPIYLGLGAMSGLGAIALYKLFNPTIEDPNNDFNGINFKGGEDLSGFGIHLWPVVYEQQRDVFEKFENIIDNYDDGLPHNFEGKPEIHTFFKYKQVGEAGYVKLSDIENGNYVLNIATENDFFRPMDDQTLLSVLVHENVHAQNSFPKLAEYRDHYNPVEGVDLNNGRHVNGDYGFIVILDNNRVSNALNEVGTEIYSTDIIDNFYGDGILDDKDFLTKSAYFDDVVNFHSMIDKYYAQHGKDPSFDEIATAFGHSMINEHSVDTFVNDLVSGFDVKGHHYEGHGGDPHVLKDMMYQFATDHINLVN